MTLVLLMQYSKRSCGVMSSLFAMVPYGSPGKFCCIVLSSYLFMLVSPFLGCLFCRVLLPSCSMLLCFLFLVLLGVRGRGGILCLFFV